MFRSTLERAYQRSVAQARAQDVGEMDRYRAYVTSHLRFNGANNGTVFTEEISGGPSWSVITGSPVTQTSVTKFDGSALKINSSMKIGASAHAAFGFGTGNYCLDVWVWPGSIGSVNTIIDTRNGSTTGVQVFLDGSSRVCASSNSAQILTGRMQLSGSIFSWVRVARQGTTLYTFVNGAFDQSVTDSRTYGSSNPCVFGWDYANSGGQSFGGYIDEFRATKGISRILDANGNVITTQLPYPTERWRP